MNQVPYGVVLVLALILTFSDVGPVQSGMMGGPMRQSQETPEQPPRGMMGQGGMGMMGPQMRRGMMGGGRPEGVGMHRPSQMVRMLRAELGLSEEQAKQVKALLLQAMKTRILQHAELRVAELEVQELLEADPVDMAQVESKLKAIEGRRIALRLAMINVHEQAKAVLTPEQRQQLERLHDRHPGMMGPDMLGMMEMMGEGGSEEMGMMSQGGMGGTGMMGPQMRHGMMGGGMGGQPQSSMPTAGSPQQLTQEDAQGAVTVRATLLTPDQPRADGRLAVRLKLETHSVDLDQYQLDKLSSLRDAQGREVQAVAVESASGSGHHREAVLTFPGADAAGAPLLKPEAEVLTLIVRGIGGIPERTFRWQLPHG